MTSPADGRLRCRVGGGAVAAGARACQHRPARSLHPRRDGRTRPRREGRLWDHLNHPKRTSLSQMPWLEWPRPSGEDVAFAVGELGERAAVALAGQEPGHDGRVDIRTCTMR